MLIRPGAHLLKQRDVWRTAKWPLFEPQTFDGTTSQLHSYYGAISQVDAAVGSLLGTLEELGTLRIPSSFIRVIMAIMPVSLI